MATPPGPSRWQETFPPAPLSSVDSGEPPSSLTFQEILGLHLAAVIPADHPEPPEWLPDGVNSLTRTCAILHAIEAATEGWAASLGSDTAGGQALRRALVKASLRFEMAVIPRARLFSLHDGTETETLNVNRSEAAAGAGADQQARGGSRPGGAGSRECGGPPECAGPPVR